MASIALVPTDVSLPAPVKPAAMTGAAVPVAIVPKATVAYQVNALAMTVCRVATVNHVVAMDAEAFVVNVPKEQNATLPEPAWRVTPPMVTTAHHPIQPTRSLEVMGAGVPLLAVVAVCLWGYPPHCWQS